ncbi:MAG: SusD/RagB family nutrient-binding outer membrane lipoprotein [Muribaculaceae bacterium]|nr:SusD/RagB family nutrient-binding outer membrane lipoprotein [Muribaculaceae bacterium]
MKSFKYIALCGVLGLGLTSCNDWLDINVNPDQPNNESILVENRLPWIQKEYTYSAGCANTRTFATCGGFYSNNGNMNYVSVTWNCVPATGLTTTPYQCWFTGTASNIGDLYNKAEAEGAYHYMGAAEVMHALGFMEMLDLYGEMPYDEALTGNPAPKYSDGKRIWEGCLAKIDHAIELFSTPQAPAATPLSSGDIWNGGDVNKWIKLCYGLKARWLLRVSKNSEYFKPDEILACLDKAMSSNNDNTFQACYDQKGDKTDFLLGDPIMTNGNWDTAAYGKNQWASKYYIDLLTNMRGAGVEDPRAEKLIPYSMTNITLDANGNVKSYDWRRAKGVDIFGTTDTRLKDGGATSITVQTFATADKELTYSFKEAGAAKQAAFVEGVKSNGYTLSTAEKLAGRQYRVDGDAVTVCYPAGAWYVNSTNYLFAGDTAYVNLNTGSQNTNNGSWGMPANDTYYHSNDQAAANAGAVSGTGSFQIYPVSDFDIMTYAEACFIKAEVLMRKGDNGGAFTAYKNGIQASIDRIQSKLNQWNGEYDNPNMKPMDAGKISAYMSSAAVAQSAGDLKMSDIMLQKYIAMGWSIENWVDMRRFNYSAGNIGSFGVVYPGYGRPAMYAGGAAFKSSNPNDATYWIRRWRLPNALELNYNAQNALAMNANALADFVWCLPVWWDCASDAEYYNYLK